MNGEVALSAKFRHFFAQIFRHGMDLRPVRIVLAIFHNAQIDIRELFANLLEMFAVTAVATNPDSTFWRFIDKRRPKGLVLVQVSTRKMPCRSCRDAVAIAKVHRFPPVEF